MGVSSVPGFTKVSQEVVLDKNIRLIDSPGIVFADGDSAATALRNCVHVETLADVMTPVQAILDRCPAPYLMQLYCIPRFKDAGSFLTLIARATGKLKKGGVPNTDAAARGVLHDWNTGKIKYYCKPPLRERGSVKESEIVDSFSAELNVDSLQDGDMRVLDEMAGDELCDYVAMDAVIEEEKKEEDKDEMEGFSMEGAESALADIANSRKGSKLSRGKRESGSESGGILGKKKKTGQGEGVDGEEGDSRAVELRKAQKLAKKRSVKEMRRQQPSVSEAYDFETDFNDETS